jgi:hypothetical protein
MGFRPTFKTWAGECTNFPTDVVEAWPGELRRAQKCREAKMISDRTRAALAAAEARGKRLGGRGPIAVIAAADCTDAHNGLLLSALWDAALDRGLISFADDGAALASSRLSETARKALDLANAPPLTGLRDAHRESLALHRTRNGF